MKIYEIDFAGRFRITEDELFPDETPEQAIYRLLFPTGVIVDEVIDVYDAE